MCLALIVWSAWKLALRKGDSLGGRDFRFPFPLVDGTVRDDVDGVGDGEGAGEGAAEVPETIDSLSDWVDPAGDVPWGPELWRCKFFSKKGNVIEGLEGDVRLDVVAGAGACRICSKLVHDCVCGKVVSWPVGPIPVVMQIGTMLGRAPTRPWRRGKNSNSSHIWSEIAQISIWEPTKVLTPDVCMDCRGTVATNDPTSSGM